jgi:hypothetical protein
VGVAQVSVLQRSPSFLQCTIKTASVSHGKAKQEGAINSFQLIDDTDAAGTIPYLAAG